MKREVLTNSVEDDYRVVHRKTYECKQRREDRQADLPLEDREESERDQHVVKNGDDRACSVCPIVSKCDEKKDPDHTEQGGDHGGVSQLGSGNRADGICSYYLVGSSLIHVKISRRIRFLAEVI